MKVFFPLWLPSFFALFSHNNKNLPTSPTSSFHQELFLAYFMLLAKGKPLSKSELDGAIERYLERTFGESVDFALENSLPFLVKDGLVQLSSDSESARLVAAPMPEALRALSAKWAAGIEPRAEGSGGDAFALLTGGGGRAALGAAGDAAALLLGGVGAGFKAVGKGLGGLGSAVGIGGTSGSSSAAAGGSFSEKK